MKKLIMRPNYDVLGDFPKKTTGLSSPLPKLFLAVCIFALCSSFVSTKQSEDDQWICEQSKYTYQIVLNERAKVGLRISICDEIEAARQQSTRAVIHYSDYVKIIVFSRDEIANPDMTIKEIVYEAK